MVRKEYSVTLLVGSHDDAVVKLNEEQLLDFVEYAMWESIAPQIDGDLNIISSDLVEIVVSNLDSRHEADVVERKLLEYLEKTYA